MNIQSTMRPGQAIAKSRQQTQHPKQPKQPVTDPMPPKDFLSTGVEVLKDTGMFILNEGREAVANDPALGLRLAANRFDAEFLSGTGNVAEGFSGMAVAFVRGGLLGANVYRANNTFHNPNAKFYQKALDVTRIATDAVGLAGAVLALAVPGMADTGRVMTQFAYGADLVSHSIRSLEHAGNRIAFLKEARAREKAAKHTN